MDVDLSFLKCYLVAVQEWCMCVNGMQTSPDPKRLCHTHRSRTVCPGNKVVNRPQVHCCCQLYIFRYDTNKRVRVCACERDHKVRIDPGIWGTRTDRLIARNQCDPKMALPPNVNCFIVIVNYIGSPEHTCN